MRGPLLVMTVMACAALALPGAACVSKEARMQITSDAFDDGATIPSRFTCDGEDVPPLLRWADPPTGTKSFALIVDDPDAPGGTFHHWGLYDIPSSARQVGEDGSAREARNDFGQTGYGGPCPPRGQGPHRYRFRLLALDVARLPLAAGAAVSKVEPAAQPHVLASAVLTGHYERH
jgi:Raf kinase inhibitor-like YbhB/YbcL family protein